MPAAENPLDGSGALVHFAGMENIFAAAEDSAAGQAFAQALAAAAAATEARLEAALKPAKAEAASPAASAGAQSAASAFWPPRLLAAMRHGVFNGGKRLRPFLVLQSAALLAAPAAAKRQSQLAAALECAAALEAVHCYSLIHDDLPAMDNDDWRRGRPTVHKAYDEATALLAGSALFTLGFALLNSAAAISAPIAQRLSRELARAAGAGGMIGGQMLDIEAERRPADAAAIIRLEEMKTGALLRFACLAGAIITEAGAEAEARLSRFGAAIGFAFQLADDILDQTGSQSRLGKTPGKDAAAGKATLVALYGLDKARALLRQKVAEAENILSPYGEKAAILRASARFIASRDH